MKILVFANTNGCVDLIKKAIDQTKIDAIIHLGNGLRDFEKINFCVPVFLTKSNKDFFVKADKIKKIDLKGTKILCTYGHKSDTKNNFFKLEKRAKQENAKLVLFGCGNKTYAQKDNIIFANPGCFFKTEGSCLLVEFFKNEIKVEDVFVDCIN